jgi:hypothetical protein
LPEGCLEGIPDACGYDGGDVWINLRDDEFDDL